MCYFVSSCWSPECDSGLQPRYPQIGSVRSYISYTPTLTSHENYLDCFFVFVVYIVKCGDFAASIHYVCCGAKSYFVGSLD